MSFTDAEYELLGRVKEMGWKFSCDFTDEVSGLFHMVWIKEGKERISRGQTKEECMRFILDGGTPTPVGLAIVNMKKWELR